MTTVPTATLGRVAGATRAAAPTSATFRAIGTTNRIHVTNPAHLMEATATAQEHLAELDVSVSRFRPDSEVSRLAARAAAGPTWAFASPMFAAYLRAGLRASRLSDGLVDPALGAVLAAQGYDADLDVVRARTADDATTPSAPTRGQRSTAPRIVLDPGTHRVSVSAGTIIDLGATAKAHAADTIAALLASRLRGGFLVNLGGDIAVGGDLPEGGWRIGVDPGPSGITQVIVSHGQAIATSSTQLRTWQVGAERRHHILDPRTGSSAPVVWAQVTCVAVSALEANTASTAAVVLGDAAPAWLAARGIPARLVRPDGTLVRTPGWPDPAGGVS